MKPRKPIPHYYGTEELNISTDRDHARRNAQPPRQSTSVNPSRCSACREWSSANAHGLCRQCHAPFVAVALVGLAKVVA